jgi:phosphoglycerate dehydrogenase-like enzyme
MTDQPGADTSTTDADREPPELHVAHAVPPDTADDLVAAIETDGRVPEAAITRGHTPGETAARLPETDGLLTFGLSEGQLDRADSLRWVQALSAGVSSYDHDALADRGVALTNVSGVHAEPIAEQVLGYMLTFARKLHVGQRQGAERRWLRYSGEEVRGKTVGVVGVGAIGGRVAELADALGATVVGTKRDPETLPDGVADAVDAVHPPAGLSRVLRRADYLVIACPLTEATRGMIGADELRTLGREAVLINVGRGAVVEQADLVRYLQADRLRGAALDVFEEEPLPPDSPLWDLPNVIVTPHQSGTTPHWPERCAAIVGENYEHLRAGRLETLHNRVV